MSRLQTPFSKTLGIEVPLICGAMYPCTNPELVAAVSEAGGIGIVQPMSLVYVHGWDFREGLREIKKRTSKPFGLNLILEKSAKAYEDRLRQWTDISVEEEVRFFVTALGNPKWIVDRVHQYGGVVYHDVTERKWAEKALAGGVDGLICVNNRAGGHAGPKSPEELMDEIGDLGVPLVCAGGIGQPAEFERALALGYAGAQLGTRFIATEECKVHDDYKQAILRAQADDIVLTEKLSGVPVAVIKTPYIERMGLRAGPLARWMLRGRKTKHWMRAIYALQSLWKLKQSSQKGKAYKDFFQAGKSVDGIDTILPAAEVVHSFRDAVKD